MAEYKDIPTEDEYDRKMLDHHLKGRQLRFAEIDGMVDKWQEIDPEVEKLLYDGTELADGMVVIVEDPHRREDIRRSLDDAAFYRARRVNRWMMIDRVKIVGTAVTFLATYEDGMQAKMEFDVSESWICKIGQPVIGTAQVPGQTSIYAENDVEAELRRLRKEDFGG